MNLSRHPLLSARQRATVCSLSLEEGKRQKAKGKRGTDGGRHFFLFPFSFCLGDPRSAKVSGRSRLEQAFTLVEVALSLAIVAFALVAIIGVMPAGFTVRKENREDTIIAHDASALIDAIRTGSGNATLATLPVALVQLTGPTTPLPGSFTAADVISRLCIPRWDGSNANGMVRAYLHGMSGNLGDVSGPNPSPVAFGYVVTSEVTNYTGSSADASLNRHLTNNLYEVKLTFQWPVYEPPTGQFPTRFGNGKLVTRTLVSGELLANGTGGYLFQGASYYGQ